MLFNQLPVHIFEATSPATLEDEDDDEDDCRERCSPPFSAFALAYARSYTACTRKI